MDVFNFSIFISKQEFKDESFLTKDISKLQSISALKDFLFKAVSVKVFI